MPLYVTVLQFKDEYKDIVGSADDTFIDRVLEAAQDAIDAYLNRVVLATSDTTEYFDYGGPEIDGYNLYLSDRGDISSITTVTNGDATTIASNEYTLYPKTLSNRRPVYDRLRILDSANVDWELPSNNDPENAISIAGKWGMWSTVATVPNDFKVSVMEMAAFLMEKRKTQVYDTTAIPDAGVITIPAGWPATVTARLRGYRRL